MDQEAKWENIISNIKEHRDVDWKVYETSNKGTLLEPRSLRREEWPTRHHVSSMGMGVWREAWIGGPQKCHGYRKWYLMKGIIYKIYPREGGIHAFQTPFIIQEHGDERNLKDELLLSNPGIFSSAKSMHNQKNDYNKRTSIPFVYESTSPKYHEPIKDWDVDDNYNPSILEWVDENYIRNFVYDDA